MELKPHRTAFLARQRTIPVAVAALLGAAGLVAAALVSPILALAAGAGTAALAALLVY
jgi:hypothetical protein